MFCFFPPIESHLDLFLNTTSAAVCLYWCTNMLTSDTLTAHTGKDNTEKPTVDYTVLHLHACIHIQECSFIRVHMISKSCSFIKNSTSAWCVNSEWGVGRICQWAYEKKHTHKKKQVIWIVWNKSTCHLGGCPDSDSANWFSCADLQGELIHVRNAAGCFCWCCQPFSPSCSHPPHRSPSAHGGT